MNHHHHCPYSTSQVPQLYCRGWETWLILDKYQYFEQLSTLTLKGGFDGKRQWRNLGKILRWHVHLLQRAGLNINIIFIWNDHEVIMAIITTIIVIIFTAITVMTMCWYCWFDTVIIFTIIKYSCNMCTYGAISNMVRMVQYAPGASMVLLGSELAFTHPLASATVHWTSEPFDYDDDGDEKCGDHYLSIAVCDVLNSVHRCS